MCVLSPLAPGLVGRLTHTQETCEGLAKPPPHRSRALLWRGSQLGTQMFPEDFPDFSYNSGAAIPSVRARRGELQNVAVRHVRKTRRRAEERKERKALRTMRQDLASEKKNKKKHNAM